MTGKAVKNSNRLKPVRLLSFLLATVLLVTAQGFTTYAGTVSRNETENPFDSKELDGRKGLDKDESNQEDMSQGGRADVVYDMEVEPDIESSEQPLLASPVHHCVKDGTDWSYIYFGSYPQSEVTDSETIDAIDSAIRTGNIDSAIIEDADEIEPIGVDVEIDGTRYRRISKNDYNYDGNSNGTENNSYRYFKWEPIKWRVLDNNDNGTLFVVADSALDCKDYHDGGGNITWEDSTVRNWLNDTFYRSAFSSVEQDAIVLWDVINENSPYGTKGGNNTVDKIYLLSIGEVKNENYGFCSGDRIYSPSRWLRPSGYANARGAIRIKGGEYDGTCSWWLRSPGSSSNQAADVDAGGYVYKIGYRVDYHYYCIVPALHINLSSDFWSVAGSEISEEGGTFLPVNPVHVCVKNDKTNWSYIYFGSYPQSEITDSSVIAAIDSAIVEGSADRNIDGTGMDVWVDGIKYRRISKNDTNYDGYFNEKPNNNGYRYFKWERIRWRVLDSNEGGTMFIVADSVLDCEAYNDEDTDITWENSTIRSWLNGSFYQTAFSSQEQNSIVAWDVVNENHENGTEGGNDTTDKIYLLSIREATKESYGFCSDYSAYSPSRFLQPSNYARTRGIRINYDNNYGCGWWLRSPGSYSYRAVYVNDYDDISWAGISIQDNYEGVAPALHINLSSDLWSTVDDGSSGEGGNNEAGVTYTVAFDSQGGSAVASQSVVKGEYALKPANPARNGYTFAGWYTDAACTEPYHFDEKVTESITLYAKWTKDSSGNTKNPANPVHHCTQEDDGSDYTDWSYVYFGSYPQSEVVDAATIDAIDSAIAAGNGTVGADDTGTDVWVNNTKYRRISKDDTNYSGYFNDEPTNNGYRYFKWERIKWRVLDNNDNGTMFVAADSALDCKNYNDEFTSITWENSTIRSWLNDSFYNTAFSNSEQDAIVAQNVVNEDNPEYDTEGGNNTIDKVYLLSIGEVTNSAYGFCGNYSTYSVSRRLQPSNYARARGTYTFSSSFTGKIANSWWWLRSPGYYSDDAAYVADGGYVDRSGHDVDNISAGVAPALHINPSSNLWYLTDDGTSGEGGGGGVAEEKILTDIRASKQKTTYEQGEPLNMDDLTVTAFYKDSEAVLLGTNSYRNNVADIDMNTPGSKTLIISYTEGTITKTAVITITVNPKVDTIPEADTTPEVETVPKVKKGTKIEDKTSTGIYKVTNADTENPTVEYTGATNTKKKTITIPEYVTYQGVKYKVTSVKAKSFKGNKKLTTVNIATSITKIGDSCFEGCTNLNTVTIGKSLQTIGKNAFKNCKKLTKITLKSTKLKTVGKNALKGVNAKCKIKVPSKQLKKYQKLFKKKGQKSSVKVVK